MRVLIVQSKADLGRLWARHLRRLGADVTTVQTGASALRLLQTEMYDVIVLDLILNEGSALTVADFANFNQPSANVVFVTDTTFFSDGSIFSFSANARAFIETRTPPDDLAEIVHHYGLPEINHKPSDMIKPAVWPASPGHAPLQSSNSDWWG